MSITVRITCDLCKASREFQSKVIKSYGRLTWYNGQLRPTPLIACSHGIGLHYRIENNGHITYINRTTQEAIGG